MRWLLAISIATCAVVATTANVVAQQRTREMQCFIEKKCEYLIGKRVWVRPIKLETVSICPADGYYKNPNGSDACKYVRSGSFVIVSVRNDSSIRQDFIVKTDDGKTARVGVDHVFSLSLTDPIAVAKVAKDECERRGQPKIGMSAAQAVETCWLAPRRIIKSTTAAGVREDYVYSLGHVLRFDNGLLSEVIETR